MTCQRPSKFSCWFSLVDAKIAYLGSALSVGVAESPVLVSFVLLLLNLIL